MGQDGAQNSQSPANQNQASKAQSRLEQVASHVSPSSASSSSSNSSGNNSNKKKRASKNSNAPPVDYSDILSQVETLQKFAQTPNKSRRGYVRQKESGKLWVRERVEQLLEKDSLEEIGSISGIVTWKINKDGKDEIEDFTPSNNVIGIGKIAGRKVCLTADDYSIRAGHADGALWHKTQYIEKLALTLRIPMIKLVDGSSGGGSVTTIAKDGFSYIPPLPSFEQAAKQVNAGIPNLGAVLGPAIGLGAARVTMCHFSVMAGNIGSLFNAGPKVVAEATFEEDLTPQDLGGPDMHCRNGTIDNLAVDERDAFTQIATVLSYLPNSGAELPPRVDTGDSPKRTEEALRSIIPRRKERSYNPRKVITYITDKDSFFEIGPLWGTTTIVGLARLAGRTVGIISLNCEVNAGALDAAGSQKLTKHLKLCDVMNIPILQFVDVPGYAIGTVAERAATMRHGVQLANTYFTTTIPIFSVVVRRVYGVAGGAMLDCRNPQFRVAWPSGVWGSLPLEGGIEVGHSHELKEAQKEGGVAAANELYKKLEDNYRRLQNPVRTANAFGVEEIVDPAQTRPVVCAWLKHVYEVLLPERLLDRKTGKINPQYA